MISSLSKISGYIVLPPGHGKSYRHLSESWLLEADTVVNCKATLQLQTLRKDAKRTGSWDEYDECWVDQLRKELLGMTVFLMVPSKSIGEKLGFQYYGAAVLHRSEWENNLGARGDIADKFAWTLENTLHLNPTMCQTNQDLDAWISRKYNDWKSQL